MSETLIPFDPEIAVKHPERVRHADQPERVPYQVACFNCGIVVVDWVGRGIVIFDQKDMRLITPSTTVMVQCVKGLKGERTFVEIERGQFLGAYWQCIGDPQPFEVPE